MCCQHDRSMVHQSPLPLEGSDPRLVLPGQEPQRSASRNRAISSLLPTEIRTPSASASV